MSFHYWRNCGRTGKRRFITLTNSYHGETLGALAVGHVELYREIYQPLLMDVITVPVAGLPTSASPAKTEDDCTPARCSRRWRMRWRGIADEVCAVIVEPLVQCAARHAHVRPGLPRAAARGLRPPRRAPDRRRDRRRLRPHRHAVRLRAGRHHARFPVPVEGPDRRLPAAVGGADAASASTRPSTTSTRSCGRSCIRTATPAIRSPAPRRSRRSTSSRTTA